MPASREFLPVFVEEGFLFDADGGERGEQALHPRVIGAAMGNADFLALVGQDGAFVDTRIPAPDRGKGILGA